MVTSKHGIISDNMRFSESDYNFVMNAASRYLCPSCWVEHWRIFLLWGCSDGARDELCLLSLSRHDRKAPCSCGYDGTPF